MNLKHLGCLWWPSEEAGGGDGQDWQIYHRCEFQSFSCFPFLNLNFSLVYLWPGILSVWLGTHFCPWIHLPSRNQLFDAIKILMLSPVTLEKSQNFSLAWGQNSFLPWNPKKKKMWTICVFPPLVFGNLFIVSWESIWKFGCSIC